MIAGLDSATPPTAAQAQAAAAAGVGIWSGYIATRPGLGLLRPWSKAEFGVVKAAMPGQPIAFCSGYDDPRAVAVLASSWGVRLCLDVESGIRDDGPWVDGFVAASGAGLYGLPGVHYHPAPFHIAATYPSSGDPQSTWPLSKGNAPTEPHGWQWAGSHSEFGVEVDRGDYDDWFGSQEDQMDPTLAAQLAAFLDGAAGGSGKGPNVDYGGLRQWWADAATAKVLNAAGEANVDYLGWSREVTAALKALAAGSPPGQETHLADAFRAAAHAIDGK